MTQKLTTIGRRTALNNEQSQCRIVSYRNPQNDKCKTIKTRLHARFHDSKFSPLLDIIVYLVHPINILRFVICIIFHRNYDNLNHLL